MQSVWNVSVALFEGLTIGICGESPRYSLRICHGKSDRGFTLIELLVTIAILGGALAPLVTAYVTSWRASLQAERTSRAVTLAGWKIDQIQTQEDFDSVSDETGNFGSEWGQAEFNQFDYEVTVSDISGDQANFEAKEVRLIVSFPDIFSSSQRTIRCRDVSTCDYDFVFLIAQKGPTP